MKNRAILFILLATLVGCQDETILVSPGDLLINREKTRGADGHSVRKVLPTGASHIKYLGGGWVTFKFEGECFLLPPPASNLAIADIFVPIRLATSA